MDEEPKEVVMTLSRSALALVLACSIAPLACEQRQEPVNTETEARDIQSPPLVEADMMSGELVSVNIDANTFKIRTEDNTEHEFRFSDATMVSGESGMQALTGREGSRVTVHYREDADGKNLASSIELSS
jgi:hypothetical protein